MTFQLKSLNLSEKEKYCRLLKDAPNSLITVNLLSLHLKHGPLDTIQMKVFAAQHKNSLLLVFTPISAVISKGTSILFCYWDPDTVSDSKVKQFLTSLPIDWRKPFMSVFPVYKMKQQFDNVITDPILSGEALMLFKNDGERATLFALPESADIPQINLPKEYTLTTLSPNDVPHIMSVWAYNFCDTVEGLQERLKYLPGVVVYYKEQDDNHVSESENSDSKINVLKPNQIPVAWSMQYITGLIGMTHTLPKHRRKGLGSSVTMEMARRIRKEGRVPYLTVEHGYTNNEEFHKKLGFVPIGECGLSVFEKKP